MTDFAKAIPPDMPLTIRRVGNGFIVEAHHHKPTVRGDDEVLVFPCMEGGLGLFRFLGEHFSTDDEK